VNGTPLPSPPFVVPILVQLRRGVEEGRALYKFNEGGIEFPHRFQGAEEGSLRGPGASAVAAPCSCWLLFSQLCR